MAKPLTILIVYGSETGNTRSAAEMIAETLRAQGHDVELREVSTTSVGALDEPFDLYLLGVSTWGAVDEEVQQDFEPFYEGLSRKDLTGRRIAVFGCGDRGYARFAKAVDFVSGRVAQRGAKLVGAPLKINLDPADSREEVEAWASALPGLMS